MTVLKTSAVGRENSKPIKWILEQLNVPGLTREDIQNHVICPSRKEGTKCFICTWHKGVFLPKNRDDALAMLDFYETRIAQEEYHAKVLSGFAITNLN